jgi:ketosteroid isomerase-like protein
MPPERVELVRRGLLRFIETGEPDWSALHEELEIHDHDIMDGEEYRGHEGFSRWLADWAQAWSSFSMELEELIDREHCVIAVCPIAATGAKSGVRVARQDAMVCRFRDGKIVRLDYYNSRQQALDAAGPLS